MSRLEELIQELCPDGVKFRRIKEVYIRLKGTPITAAKMKEIENPNGEIRIFAGGKTVINAFEKDIPNANIIKVPAVLVQSRGIIDFIYYDQPFTFKNEMWAYTANNAITVKYLYYVLKNNVEYFRNAASGMGSLPQISLPITEEFVIPVPPIEVQREIVRILDTFSEQTEKLIAELKAELETRKKQYEYYREILLNKKDKNSKNLKIIDMLSQPITDGPHTTPEFHHTGIPFVSAESIWDGKIHFDKVRGYISEEFDLACAKKYKPQEHDVLMVKSGSTTGKVAYVDTDKSFNIWSPLAALRVNKDNSARYLFYLLQTKKVQEQVKKKSSHGSQPNLSMRALEQFEVNVPPLEEQQRIVDILDRYDAIYNEITQKISAEIELRRKQYEYYRDKLLTFKELDA